MKFLCDAMLSRLGRWLRAAGYDTRIAEPGQEDGELIAQAMREHRLLVSLDLRLLEFRQAKGLVIILKTNKIRESIQQLTELLDIDWLYRPFSRCLLCNGQLVKAGPEVVEHLPEDVRDRGGMVYYCAGCEQSYWHGGHVARMRRKLGAWNAFRP